MDATLGIVLAIVVVLATLYFLGVLTGITKVGKKRMAPALVISALLVVGIFGFGFDWNISNVGNAFKTQAVGQQVVSTGSQVVTPSGEVACRDCPSTGQTNYYVRVRDTLASTLTYVSGQEFYVFDKGNSEYINGTTSGTAGTWSTAQVITCGADFDGYLLTLKTNDATSGATSAKSETFKACGQRADQSREVKATSMLQARVENIPTDSYAYHKSSGTAFTNINKSFYFNGTTEATSGFTVGADGYLDLKLHVKTRTTNTQFGEDGLRTWMFVDAVKAYWQEPSVGINGVKLTDQLASVYTDDKTASPISDAEYGYVLPGPLLDIDTPISFYIKTASGQNPTGAQNVTITFCAEGRYKSDDEPNKIKIGCFNDATSQAWVAQTLNSDQQIVIQVG